MSGQHKTETERPGVYVGDHERAVLRTAAREHRCWSWSEKCSAPGDGYDGNPPCTRIIAKGEKYLLSTIYPGHDSGYADDRVRLVKGAWVPVAPSPISSRFCLPCAGRWVNLKPALDLLQRPVQGRQ